jgi:signal transduction histidine kinase
MKIAIKTLIALLATTICLILILNFFSNTVIQSNFSKIEQDQVTSTIYSTQVAVENRIKEMDSTLQSWCQLNSTYQFIRNQTSEYQETYLTVNSLSKININFIFFLNTESKFVAGMGLNLVTLQQISIPQDILTQVSNNSMISSMKSLDSYTYGFIMTAEGPLMIAARPIFMTDGAGLAMGASGGVLVFARYYDSSEISKLSEIMNFPMSIEPIGEWEKENHIQSENLTSSYIKPLNQQVIMGYDVIDDINDQPIFVIGASIPRTVYDEGISTVNYIDQVLLLAGIVFSALIVILLEFSVLRRLSNLTNSVVKLGHRGDDSQELAVSGNDEITWLTLSINGFLQEIQTQTQKLQKSERLSAIGELARQVGHDLRNPLSSTKNATYFLRRKGNKCSDKDREYMLDIIEADIKHSDKIINDLIEYASEIYLDLEDCSPKELLKGGLSNVQVPECVNVVDNALEEPKLRVDVDKIERVFTLIIKNALDAMPKGGTLKISSVQKDENVQIAFADTGEGIPKDLLPKIFSPLLTTKAQGMGFSLAICKRIVDCHGGKIEVESVFGEGTTFRVTLPFTPQIAQDPKAHMFKPDPLIHYESVNEAVAASSATKFSKSKNF